MTHKIIILNGPPGCGKDTAAMFLYKSGLARHFKFAEPVKRAARELLNVPDTLYRELERVGNQELRNERRGDWGNSSWREVCIWIAESTKERFGNHIFGDFATQRCIRSVTNSPATVFSDGGFHFEVAPLVSVYGPKNVAIWRIHRDGCTFDGDSRNYIDQAYLPPGVTVLDINNEHELDMFEVQIMMRARKFLGISDDGQTI